MKATSLNSALVVAILIGCWLSGVNADQRGNGNGSNRNLYVQDPEGNLIELPRMVPRNADPSVGPGLSHQIGVLMDQNRALFEGAAQQFKLQADLLSILCRSGFSGRPCPVLESKTVFVTSSLHYGTLPGVAAADFLCNVRAATAGLTGHFLAWISDSEATEPRVRFVRSSVPYALPGSEDSDPVIIANNWDDLVDGSLEHPIFRDEFGNEVSDSFVWTATDYDGSHYQATDLEGNPASVDCGDWETSESSVLGLLGSPHERDESWSFYIDWDNIIPSTVGIQNCSGMARLYCFEQ